MPNRHVTWRLWWLTMVSMVLTIVISISASVRIAGAREERARQAERAAAVEIKRVTCDLVAKQHAAYAEATTPVGLAVREAWLRESQILGCDPI